MTICAKRAKIEGDRGLETFVQVPVNCDSQEFHILYRKKMYNMELSPDGILVGVLYKSYQFKAPLSPGIYLTLPESPGGEQTV